MNSGELSYFKSGPRILNDHFVIDPTEFQLWNLSYSMFGEDLILRGMQKAKLRSGVPGFYVDLGSYDPRYGNNSYLFYRYGWRGVCVEANPKVAPMYPRFRPHDVFINAAVGEAGKGFWAESASPAESRIAKTRDQFGPDCQEPIELDFLPLKTIFDQHVPAGTPIDFMSMDIEGSELSALRSNDWSRYRPGIILMEVHGCDVTNLDRSAPLRYLRGLDYKIEGFMFPNAVLTAK